jgi:hypothetical protein
MTDTEAVVDSGEFGADSVVGYSSRPTPLFSDSAGDDVMTYRTGSVIHFH